jgi:threonine dehydrogenase-like Zn-dependent dehydrogenase
VACGFGTVYEGLEKIGISGNHAVLITGLGPVGLATGALCRKLGAHKIIGIDVLKERMQLALDLRLCDEVLASGPDNVAEVRRLTRGMGVERAVDCSANDQARATAIRATANGDASSSLVRAGASSSTRRPTSSTIRKPSTEAG